MINPTSEDMTSPINQLYPPIAGITTNLNGLERVLKIIKKRKMEGKLPPGGGVTLLTYEEAQEMISKLPPKPDCSTMGYVQQIIMGGIKELALKEKAKDKVFSEIVKKHGTKAFWGIGAILFTPDELVKKELNNVIPKTISKAGLFVDILRDVQRVIEGGVDAYYDHQRRCDLDKASRELPISMSKEVIATIEYSSPSITSLKKEAEKPLPPSKKTSNHFFTTVSPPNLQINATSKPINSPNLSQPQKNILQQSIQVIKPQNPNIFSDLRGNINIDPHPKQMTISPTVKLFDNTASVIISPLNPRQSSVSISHRDIGISLPPKKIKNSQITVGGSVKEVGVGVQIPIKNPLKSRCFVKVPVAIPSVPIPLLVGVDGQLNRLDKLKLKLEIPLGPLNKLTSKIGIKFPQSIPVLSLDVKNTVKKAGKKIENGVKKIFRKKHKHENASANTSYKISMSFDPDYTQLTPELLEACKNLIREISEYGVNSRKLGHEVQLLSYNTEELKKIITEIDTSIQTLKTEQQLLGHQVQAMAKSHSLEDSSKKLSDINESLATNTPLLVSVLKKKMPKEIAANILESLSGS